MRHACLCYNLIPKHIILISQYITFWIGSANEREREREKHIAASGSFKLKPSTTNSINSLVNTPNIGQKSLQFLINRNQLRVTWCVWILAVWKATAIHCRNEEVSRTLRPVKLRTKNDPQLHEKAQGGRLTCGATVYLPVKIMKRTQWCLFARKLKLFSLNWKFSTRLSRTSLELELTWT